MTVFIMRSSSQKTENRRERRESPARRESSRLLFALLCLLSFVFCLPSPARAAGVEALRQELTAMEPGGYALSADFRVDFNARLEEAVAHGVPLVFELEFRLERPRWYWTDETIARKRQAWRLSYHALTRQYRLSIGALHQSFATLEDAIQVFSHVRRWQVLEANLKPGSRYAASLRLRLDVSQLPKPFQVSAFTNRDWSLDSGWQEWDFIVPQAAANAAPDEDAPPEEAQ
ncbi:MAG: DUF4390 domain-containing protein [Zoogloeaceae bacterium]|jgi:hypothetical protein|nr:DUF4390 domain-containing protein [Zoogloeaceae bacterium]